MNCTDFMPADVKMCQKPFTYWVDGICYSLHLDNKTQTQAAAACAANGSELAVIRSADIAMTLMQVYAQANPQATSATIWIGAPANNKTLYYPLDDTADSSDVIIMYVKNLVGGQCLTANAGQSSGDYVVIKDNITCTTAAPYACETQSTFVKKGCGQPLGANVGWTINATSPMDCGINCSYDASCLGVNYNNATHACQGLTQNTCTVTIPCNTQATGGDYYERV